MTAHLLPRDPADEFVHDALSEDNWRTGVTFFFDDAADPYDDGYEPTQRWHAVVRVPQRFGHGETNYRLSDDLQQLIESFVAQTKEVWE